MLLRLEKEEKAVLLLPSFVELSCRSRSVMDEVAIAVVSIADASSRVFV